MILFKIYLNNEDFDTHVIMYKLYPIKETQEFFY